MKRKPIIIIALFILLAAAAWVVLKIDPFSGNGSAGEEEGEMRTWNLHVQQRGNDRLWRVWDAGGVNRGHLRVRAGDSINWRAAGSAMDFRFSRDVNDYFTFESGTFQNDSAHVNRNDWLRVTVRENAPRDSLEYQVYVVNADTFAVGNSPPVLIVY
ncbi:MAG: hypothetical protein U5K31_12380 [Balneolaceae bacterium]|nr:hypothetical protein [Balneolaceae bacterium]